MSTNNFIQKATSTPGTFVDSLIFEPGTLGTNTVLLQIPVGTSNVATIYIEGIVSASHPGIRLDKDGSDTSHTQLLTWSIDDEVQFGIGMDTGNVDFVLVYEPDHGDIFRFSPGGHAALGPGVSSPQGDATLEFAGSGGRRQISMRGSLNDAELSAIFIETTFNPGATGTPGVGNAAYAALLAPVFTTTATRTHPRFVTLELRPPSISGSGAVTDAASLYITAAPSGATNNYAIYVSAGTSRFDTIVAAGLLDLSGIAAGSAELKVTATSDTPSVTWGTSTQATKVSGAPAGYIKITVGASSRYIPFWA